jgi:hypothetical protein
MSDQLCTLCGNAIYGRSAVYDTSQPADDRRYGPYHIMCIQHRAHVNGAGEYVLSQGESLYGMPYLITMRHRGWLPERFAVWAADKLIRLAFRVIGQRGRFVEEGEYFHAGLMQKPWATSWMTAKKPKER